MYLFFIYDWVSFLIDSGSFFGGGGEGRGNFIDRKGCGLNSMKNLVAGFPAWKIE